MSLTLTMTSKIRVKSLYKHISIIDYLQSDDEKNKYFLGRARKEKFEVAEYYNNGMWLAIVIQCDPDYEYLDTSYKRTEENFHDMNKAINLYLYGDESY